MVSRDKNGYQKLIYDFIKDILVVCPQCTKNAIVKCDEINFQELDKGVKIICTFCGFNKRLTEKSSSVLSTTFEGKYFVIGAPVDPFFYLALWLKENVGGEQIWAYNYEHLEFIENFVDSKLRERNGQEPLNKSLGSRLPKWITSKSNREPV